MFRPTDEVGRQGRPNYTLALADFPLHVLADPLNRDSAILYSSDDVIGSQGVFDANFVQPGQSRFDDCTCGRTGFSMWAASTPGAPPSGTRRR
jgi:hypothetical protein